MSEIMQLLVEEYERLFNVSECTDRENVFWHYCLLLLCGHWYVLTEMDGICGSLRIFCVDKWGTSFMQTQMKRGNLVPEISHFDRPNFQIPPLPLPLQYKSQHLPSQKKSKTATESIHLHEHIPTALKRGGHLPQNASVHSHTFNKCLHSSTKSCIISDIGHSFSFKH